VVYRAPFLDQLRRRTRLSDLVGRCGVKLVRRGREFVGLCPFHRERTPSFTVTDDKQFFHCFGCGAHGDVFSFVARIYDVDFRTAVETIATGLGSQISAVPPPAARLDTSRRSDNEERNRRLAWRLWAAALDPRGTPVERYLHHRGLELPSMPVLRWAPSCWHPSGIYLPAMVGVVLNVDGEPIAVHRTFLRPDGSGKADILPQRASLGPIAGGAVRLHEFRSGAPLIIAEGIESALAMSELTRWPAWAGLSASGVERLKLPPDARDIVIAVDRDRNGTGERSARRAGGRWFAEGRRVRLIIPDRIGADADDLLRKTHHGG
jgi:putative DNA primase/helicase